MSKNFIDCLMLERFDIFQAIIADIEQIKFTLKRQNRRVKKLVKNSNLVIINNWAIQNYKGVCWKSRMQQYVKLFSIQLLIFSRISWHKSINIFYWVEMTEGENLVGRVDFVGCMSW